MMNPEQINVTVSNGNVIINKLLVEEYEKGYGIRSIEIRNDTQKRREVTAENRPQRHDNLFNVTDKNEQNSFSKTRFCLPKPVPANSNFK